MTTSIKLTKKALNDIIEWTSTRYNDWLGYGTKKYNVDIVYAALKSGIHEGKEVFAIQCASPVGENYYAKAAPATGKQKVLVGHTK